KRKVIDWLRKHIERRVHEEPLSDHHEDALFTRGGKWKIKVDHWSADNPGRELTRREFRDALAACLQGLPPPHRPVFVLKVMAEGTWESVCWEIGATPTNLWVMLHRARLRLWRCLTEKWFGGEPTDS